MRTVIDGRSADVHAYNPWVDRLERLFAPRQGIIDFDRHMNLFSVSVISEGVASGCLTRSPNLVRRHSFRHCSDPRRSPQAYASLATDDVPRGDAPLLLRAP